MMARDKYDPVTLGRMGSTRIRACAVRRCTAISTPGHDGRQWIWVADREAGFYEPIERCQRHQVDFVIRGYHRRALANDEGHLPSAVAQAPVRGTMSVEVRSRPGQPTRTATVTVRSCAVTVVGPWRPHGQQPTLTFNVEEAREQSPTQGVEALHWILLTSLPVSRWAEVQRVIGIYTARWWIEEYHKALKNARSGGVGHPGHPVRKTKNWLDTSRRSHRHPAAGRLSGSQG